MTEPMYGYSPLPSSEASAPKPRVRPGRLWAGGAATSVVAGLIVLVGVMIVRGVLDMPILGPEGAGEYGGGQGVVTSYALFAVAAALLATALMHVLVVAFPRPLQFFGWITGLVTVAVALVPLMVSAPLEARVAGALINLVTGLAILSLIGSVAAASVRPPARRRP